MVFKEQVNDNVSLLAEIRVRYIGRNARNGIFKFHNFVRGRAATVRFEAESAPGRRS